MNYKKMAFGAFCILHEICAMIGMMFLLGFLLGWSSVTWHGWSWPL